MAARAYKMADAIRATGARLSSADRMLRRFPMNPSAGETPRHADAIALGEADHTWPLIVADAQAGNLKEIYRPVDKDGIEVKPSLKDYPEIPWQSIDLKQFDLVAKLPSPLRSFIKRKSTSWESLYVVPVESGRGCPYGCDFCTVTGFFGDAIRFRTNQSVVDELLRLKQRAKGERGTIGVFFIDDNFAINLNRTKSLLREIIRPGGCTPLGCSDQCQPFERRRASRSDRGERRTMDLCGAGIGGCGQSPRGEQGFQQTRRV